VKWTSSGLVRMTSSLRPTTANRKSRNRSSSYRPGWRGSIRNGVEQKQRKALKFVKWRRQKHWPQIHADSDLRLPRRSQKNPERRSKNLPRRRGDAEERNVANPLPRAAVLLSHKSFLFGRILVARSSLNVPWAPARH